MKLMVELVWLGRIVGECGVVGEVHIEDGDEVWLPSWLLPKEVLEVEQEDDMEVKKVGV